MSEQKEENSGHYTVQPPVLFRELMSVRVLYTFLRYILTGTEDDKENEAVGAFIAWLPCLDTLMGTAVEVLTEKDTPVLALIKAVG